MITSDTYYKFLPIDRISYLDDQLLRFTQPADLNDPFECYPRAIDESKLFDTIKQVITNSEKFKSNPPDSRTVKDIINESIKDFIPKTYDKINQEIGILSLSKTWKSSLMWSHYCLSHIGFCIGYEKAHNFFDDFLNENLNQSQHTKEVDYQNTRAEINVGYPVQKPDFEILLTKSKEWDYEKEVRVIKTLNLRHALKKNDQGGLDVNLFEVPHNSIKEIIVGVKIQLEPKEKIIQFCKKNQIKLYQAIISDTTFDMERNEIIL